MYCAVYININISSFIHDIGFYLFTLVFWLGLLFFFYNYCVQFAFFSLVCVVIWLHIIFYFPFGFLVNLWIYSLFLSFFSHFVRVVLFSSLLFQFRSNRMWNKLEFYCRLKTHKTRIGAKHFSKESERERGRKNSTSSSSNKKTKKKSRN